MNKLCSRCGHAIKGEVYYEKQGIPLSWKCYCSIQQEKQIHAWDYSPRRIFYGSGTCFLEVELELAGDTDGEKVCQIMRKANCGRELLYCKRREGAIKGMIIASHPMTLGFHLSVMPWQAVLSEIKRLDYRICTMKIKLLL